MELLIISEFKLLLCIGEMNEAVVVDPMLIVLFIILPEEFVVFVLRGMYLLEPPF
jgi:hypothetical protein